MTRDANICNFWALQEYSKNTKCDDHRVAEGVSGDFGASGGGLGAPSGTQISHHKSEHLLRRWSPVVSGNDLPRSRPDPTSHARIPRMT